MSSPRHSTQAPAATAYEPIADVLTRVRDELDKIAGSIDDMQAVVGQLTWDLASQDPQYMRAMQSIDHSAQIVAGLGDFLVAIAKEIPADWRLDPTAAVRIVRLADLASRLSSAEAEKKQALSDGDVDFF